MFIEIDPANATAALADADNFSQFHISVSGGDAAAALAGLGADGAATDQPDQVWVSVAAVRRWAADQVDEGWEPQFAKMLEFAEDRDWLDPDRTHIQAHIETKGN
jgi:hypothetical protein